MKLFGFCWVRNPGAHVGCCTQNPAETTFHLMERLAGHEQGLEAARWTVSGLSDLYTASPEPIEFSSRPAQPPPLLSSASSSFIQPSTQPSLKPASSQETTLSADVAP